MIAVIIGVLFFLGATLPVFANYNPFYWDLLVTEVQKYVFNGSHSPNHYRFIKLDKIKEIRDVQIWEGDRILPGETYINGDQFWIRWQ